MLKEQLLLKSGDIVVRLAETTEEILKAQKLRYDMLVLEFDNSKDVNGSDASEYDKICDHLIAIDQTTNKVVGTYRLLSNKHLKSNEAFICENEFDVSKLKNCNYDILELGRAVVDKEYRNGVVIKLLWQGLFNYCKMHNIRFMFGTGSFHGVNYEENKQAFAYLHKYHKISDEFDCVAKAPSVTLDMLNFDEIDERAAKTQIPALLKGYISLGSKVGTGVYLDYEFNSSDVMIILDMQNINAAFAKRMFGVEL